MPVMLFRALLGLVILLTLILPITGNASFSLNFSSNKMPVPSVTYVNQVLSEISEQLPNNLKNHIDKEIKVFFTPFSYNKINLTCEIDRLDLYTRPTANGCIEINQMMLLEILNRHLDRVEFGCTYRNVLKESIIESLMEYYAIDIAN